MRAELEHAPVDSQYVEARHVPTTGPAHVILGSYAGVHSPARAPDGVTYLLLRLAAGTRWTFTPPAGQTLAWLAVASGRLVAATPAQSGEMLVFETSGQSIALEAGLDADAVFVIGAAVPHPHALHLGNYSVHTSAAALETGEAHIERLRQRLLSAGDRRGANGTVPVFRD